MGKLKACAPSYQKLKLIDPAGNDIGVTLHVVGKDSKQYREVLMKRASKEEAVEGKTTMRDQMEAGAELICALVVGVDEEDAFDSKDFKKELYELLMGGEYDWVAAQVNELSNQRAAFFKGSQSNSASA